jgi:hypothetical protein
VSQMRVIFMIGVSYRSGEVGKWNEKSRKIEFISAIMV